MYFCQPFETHLWVALFIMKKSRCSSVVEYILGKDGVMSSTLINGSFFFEMNIRIKINNINL